MNNQTHSKNKLNRGNINVPVSGKLAHFLKENRGTIGLAAGVIATTTLVSAKNFQPIKKVEDINPELPALSEQDVLKQDGAYLSIDAKDAIYAPSEGLNFSDAFKEARENLGPGGIFEWEGKFYNTFFAEEWESLTQDQKKDFAGKVSESINEKNSAIVEVENGELITAEFNSDNILKLSLENDEVIESLRGVEIDMTNDGQPEIELKVDSVIKEPSTEEEVMDSKEILVDSVSGDIEQEGELGEAEVEPLPNMELDESAGLEFDDLPENQNEKTTEESDETEEEGRADLEDMDELNDDPLF